MGGVLQDGMHFAHKSVHTCIPKRKEEIGNGNENEGPEKEKDRTIQSTSDLDWAYASCNGIIFGVGT